MRRKTLAGVALSVSALVLAVPTSMAGPLPDNCTKNHGEVVCTTFDGPGNNQAGVGETTTTDTQGNTTNFSPEPLSPGAGAGCEVTRTRRRVSLLSDGNGPASLQEAGPRPCAQSVGGRNWVPAPTARLPGT